MRIVLNLDEFIVSMTSPLQSNVWMLRPNSGRERALFGRNRGDEGATCKKPQARRHTHLGPETASGSEDYVAASTAIGARAVQRLHRDRGLTLQAGAAALRRRQGKSHSKLANCSPIYGWFTEGFDTLDLKEAKALLN